MIMRVWHGWTTPENADPYENLLREEILPGILRRGIAGYHGAQLFRREDEAEIEFLTILTFDSLEAVRAFAGDDVGHAVVPAKARELLKRFDKRSQHYERIPLD